jgi:hypothetical protein
MSNFLLEHAHEALDDALNVARREGYAAGAKDAGNPDPTNAALKARIAGWVRSGKLSIFARVCATHGTPEDEECGCVGAYAIRRSAIDGDWHNVSDDDMWAMIVRWAEGER